MGPRRYLGVGAVAAAAVLVQLGVSAAGFPYLLTQLTMSAYLSLVALGLCLVMGYAGQVSLGHAAFSAIGGYTVAVLTTRDLAASVAAPAAGILERLGLLSSRADIYGTEILAVSPWAAALAAILLATIAALLIGIPALRLRGHYLAMATLGFGLIVHRVLLGTPLLGGADGITGVPPFRIAFLELSGRSALRLQNYYIAWGVVLFALVLGVNLVGSRVGRALRAIHESEEAARALGVDTSRYKLAAFVTSAILSAIAGVLLTHYSSGIGPSEASVMRSIRFVAIVAVGGMANMWGALVASVVLNFLSLRGVFGSYDDAVFGAVLVLVMVFSPDGLPGLAEQARGLAERFRRKRSSPETTQAPGAGRG